MLQEEIEGEFVGPDCYWNDPDNVKTSQCISHFGTAWWIPFPPTLVSVVLEFHPDDVTYL